MKRYIVLLALCLISAFSFAQEWLKAAESDNDIYYVSSTIRQRGNNYIIFEKCVPKNISAERNNRVRETGESKWYKYSYMIVTELADLEVYRTKSLNYAYYDTEGKVLYAFDSMDDTSWFYAKPGTILEGICETAEYIVKRK